MNVILQKLPSCWEAIPATPGLKVGFGSTIQEALGALVLENPTFFGLGVVEMDMRCSITREHVERLELPKTLVNTTGRVPVPFNF